MSTKMDVRVVTKASVDKIGEVRDSADGKPVLVIYVKAVPEKNKANETVLRLLAKHLNIPLAKLRIFRGQTNRNKVIEIDD